MILNKEAQINLIEEWLRRMENFPSGVAMIYIAGYIDALYTVAVALDKDRLKEYNEIRFELHKIYSKWFGKMRED